MSVFAGGCDLNALAAVAVTEGADGGPRLGMLETIRQYALERLGQAGDLDDTRRRHAEYHAEFAERVGGQLRGPAHLTSLDRLEAEHDNLRAALAWSLNIPAPGSAGDGERAVTSLRLVQPLGPFWYRHGHATEGRRWLERAIALASDQAGAPLAKVACWLGTMVLQQGESDAALRLFERSLAIWRDLGEPDEQARELISLGLTHFPWFATDFRTHSKWSRGIAVRVGDGLVPGDRRCCDHDVPRTLPGQDDTVLKRRRLSAARSQARYRAAR